MTQIFCCSPYPCNRCNPWLCSVQSEFGCGFAALGSSGFSIRFEKKHQAQAERQASHGARAEHNAATLL
jgi:hypothetical protein